MQQLHLQDEESLKSQRVTDAEAQQIVHLWAEAQKQAATTSGPTVHDIAEGLEIPTEEALRLLAQVRQKQVSQTESRVHTRSRAPFMLAVAVMAAIAIMLMGLLVSFRAAPEAPAVTVAAPGPVFVDPPRNTPPPSGVTQPAPQPGGHPTTGLPR